MFEIEFSWKQTKIFVEKYMERKHAVIPALVILDIIMCYLKNCSNFLEKLIHVHIKITPFLVPIFKGFLKENNLYFTSLKEKQRSVMTI